MSYAAGVAPDAVPEFQTLDIAIQELVLDLLEQLASEGPSLQPLKQRHLVVVSSGGWRVDAYLAIGVDHERRAVTLIAVDWLTGRL